MRKRVWIPLGVAATAAIVIAVLPFAIERLAEGWLRDQGVPNPAIGDVDFNPFTGLLRVESATFSGAAGERGEVDLLEIDLEPSALFSRRALAARLAVAGGRFDVGETDDGRYRVGGLTFPLASETKPTPAADDEEPWGAGLAGVSIENVEITYRDPRFDSRAKVRRLSLDRIATWEPDSTSRLRIDMTLDGAAIGVEAQAAPLAREPNARLKLNLERLAVGAYPIILEASGLSRADGLLSLDLNASGRYRTDAAVVEIDGDLSLEQAEIGLPTATVSSAQVTWSGDLSATVPASPGSPLELSGTSALALHDSALIQRDSTLELVAFERLQIGGGVIQGLGRIDVDHIELLALELLRGADADAAVWSIAEARLEDASITEASVAIESARLRDSVLRLEREPDGQLRLVSAVMSNLAPAALEPAEPAEPSPTETSDADHAGAPAGFGFRLGSFELAGESLVRFRDQSVDPVLSSTFAIKSLRVTGVDSSEPAQPMRVSFEIQQDDGATLVGEGEVAPFGPELVTNLNVALDRLNLTQLSSYLPGYNIQRGRLDLDADARIKGDALEVTNSLVIEKLKLAGKAAGEQSLLGEGMAMPLDVALDLLRDGDDRIKLELPVSGSLSDPQFGTGDIVRTAMQNALQKAAISYAKNALQPLGTILLIGKLAGKAARPRFEPLTFAPGTAELTPEARAYLDKIGQLLIDRQGLSITFCGVSTPADRDHFVSLSQQALAAAETGPEPAGGTGSETEAPAEPGGDEAADAAPDAVASDVPPPSFETERLELAGERGNAMQEYLTATRGIDAARLFRCRPTLDSDTEASPRVEITL